MWAYGACNKEDSLPLIMVTGAAGFIGSVVAQALLTEGVEVLAVDNLSRGHRVAIAEGATFYRIGVGDALALEKIFLQYKVDAVVHLAGFTQVGESVENPALYYSNNLRDGLTLFWIYIFFGPHESADF